MMDKKQGPYCLTCRHCRVEQGHKQPHICMLWGIRTGSMQLPNQAIFQALRRNCQYYEPGLEEEKPPEQRGGSDGLDITV